MVFLIWLGPLEIIYAALGRFTVNGTILKRNFQKLIETTLFSLNAIYPVRSILKYLTPKEFIDSHNPVGHMELFVNVIYMFTYRFRADEQFSRNFLVHQAL